MKIVCAPSGFNFKAQNGDLDVVLFGPAGKNQGCIGEAIHSDITRQKLAPAPRAWDFLAFALAVVSADLAGHRSCSPDGWTREFNLVVAVADKKFWDSQVPQLEKLLGFLSTDRWKLTFVKADLLCPNPEKPIRWKKSGVVLVSGGLDSLIGALDLYAKGKKPLVVSQISHGDKEKQHQYAAMIGGRKSHLQLNHNASIPGLETPPSQRARSIAFIAYAVLGATTLAKYAIGKKVSVNVCENGMIAINAPMTDLRIGSLSTRTAHPIYLTMIQNVLDDAGLAIRIRNPYKFKTKGEMLKECSDQTRLKKHASETTSCGRFRRYGYQHCGRCIPCLIRRAAFKAWGNPDNTSYKFKDLSKKGLEYSKFDDVRSAAMAIATVNAKGVERWLGPSVAGVPYDDFASYNSLAKRGLAEIERLLTGYGIK